MRWRIAGLVVIAVLLVAYWFATGGLPKRRPPAWLTEGAVAHRGEWVAAPWLATVEGVVAQDPRFPENSLPAFRRAIERGYAIELDVQLTSDDQVIVFHDDDLKRMTGVSGAVAETPLAIIQGVRLLGGPEAVPTLRQVLDLVGGRVPILIEVKNRGAVGALESALGREISAYEGPVAVMSFNPFSLKKLAEVAPDVPRGQLSGGLGGEGLKYYEVFMLSNLLMNWTSRPDFIGYDIRDLPTLGTTIQRWRGRPLMGWTADTERQRTAAAKYCDVVECNPEALP